MVCKGLSEKIRDRESGLVPHSTSRHMSNPFDVTVENLTKNLPFNHILLNWKLLYTSQ